MSRIDAIPPHWKVRDSLGGTAPVTQAPKGKPRQRDNRGDDGLNETERRYLREVLEPQDLAGEIVVKRHESMRFELADRSTISPDWPVWRRRETGGWDLEMHECKAGKADGKPLVQDEAWQKLKFLARLNPEIRVLVVWPLKPGGWQALEVRR